MLLFPLAWELTKKTVTPNQVGILIEAGMMWD